MTFFFSVHFIFPQILLNAKSLASCQDVKQKQDHTLTVRFGSVKIKQQQHQQLRQQLRQLHRRQLLLRITIMTNQLLFCHRFSTSSLF